MPRSSESGTRGLAGRTFESRVVGSMEQLLALLKRHQSKGTFFVLGEVASAHPSLVRKIAEEQHEVACHGDRHEDVYRQSPREFRADVRRPKRRSNRSSARKSSGIARRTSRSGRSSRGRTRSSRKRDISTTRACTRFITIATDNPTRRSFPHEIWTDGRSSLTEFPIGTARVMGMNLPIGGGGFFRLLPFPLIRLGMRRVNLREEQP